MLFIAAVTMRALERLPAWVVWSLAVLLGQLARQFEHRVRMRRIFGIMLLVGGLSDFLLGLVAPLDIELANFGTPALSVLVSAVLCTGLVWVAEAILDGRPIPGAGLISELAMVLVVVRLTHTFAFIPPFALGFRGLVVLAFAVCASWSLGLLIHRTPASMIVAGVPALVPTKRLP